MQHKYIFQVTVLATLRVINCVLKTKSHTESFGSGMILDEACSGRLRKLSDRSYD